MRRLTLFLLPLTVVSVLIAAPPGWWSAEQTRILEEEGEENNYAPANLGQLKHVAKMAKIHLDTNIAGGSGSAVNGLVTSFVTGTAPEEIALNYAPLNLGQIKAVAKPFYDRLHEAGYDTRANLIAHGFPDKWSGTAAWTGYYPWNPATPVAENYSPANIGQLKMTFSFDLEGFDSDEDGLPDFWEQTIVDADPFDDIQSFENVDPSGNFDGDSLTNFEEWELGLNPLDPSDAQGRLEIVSGGEQTVSPSGVAVQFLRIKALDFLDRAMPGVGINLRVEAGKSARLRAGGSTDPFVESIGMTADGQGEVSVELRAGDQPGMSSLIVLEASFSPSASTRIHAKGWLGIWDFNEGFGSDALDHSGFARPMRLHGVGWVAGPIRSAVQFTGTESGWGIADNSAATLELGKGDFTVMAWFRTTHSGTSRVVGQGYDGARPGFALEIGVGGEGRISAAIGDPNGEQLRLTTTQAFNDGNWHHVGVVFDRTTGSAGLLVDGVRRSVQAGLIPSGASLTNVPVNAAVSADAGESLMIGRARVVADNFEGDLDEMSLFRGVLSDGEISDFADMPDDSDSDGLPDIWEQQIIDASLTDNINSLADVLPGDDFDGDGISNLDEFLASSSPIDFFNGYAPQILLGSGDGQTGISGVPLLYPISIDVLDKEGRQLRNAPLHIVPEDENAEVGNDGENFFQTLSFRYEPGTWLSIRP